MHPEQDKRSPTVASEGGIVPLEDIGALRFDGNDAAGFLQGYLTTDTDELGSIPRFTAMCNIKGRVVCTGYTWLSGQAVTLVLHRSLCSATLEFLRPYLAFSKTTATETPVLVYGALHWDAPAAETGSLDGGRLDSERQLFVIDDSKPGKLVNSAPVLERSHWDRQLIERREVWLETATSGRFLPQMLRLEEIGAVSFTKGCYLGQEVVARAQHRGEVKRRLAALNWSGTPPVPGAGVEADGREVGVVVAAAGTGSSGEALAVLVRGQPGPFGSPESDTRFQLAA